MKNKVLFLTLVWMLAACAPMATPEPLPTATLPLPPPSPTPSSAPTYTPSPTPTPTLQPIVLGNFSAQLEGVGSNGTMACYTYDGAAADLEGLTLTANIS